MQIKPKIVLKEKNESVIIPIKNLQATLSWKTNIDLDFYAFYTSQNIQKKKKKKGLFSKLKSYLTNDLDFDLDFDNSEKIEKVYYGSKGSTQRFPFIKLDVDAGIGDVGGNNEENMMLTNLSVHRHILLAVNIFNKPNARFSAYDGKVTVKGLDQSFEVPLTAKESGNWCVIARVDNTYLAPKLINVNKILKNQPRIADFI